MRGTSGFGSQAFRSPLDEGSRDVDARGFLKGLPEGSAVRFDDVPVASRVHRNVYAEDPFRAHIPGCERHHTSFAAPYELGPLSGVGSEGPRLPLLRRDPHGLPIDDEDAELVLELDQTLEEDGDVYDSAA